jgi:hypothetical protein
LGKSRYRLAARLPYFAKLDNGTGRRRAAELLGELSPGAG